MSTEQHPATDTQPPSVPNSQRPVHEALIEVLRQRDAAADRLQRLEEGLRQIIGQLNDEYAEYRENRENLLATNPRRILDGGFAECAKIAADKLESLLAQPAPASTEETT